jgi:hypothetical protein
MPARWQVVRSGSCRPRALDDRTHVGLETAERYVSGELLERHDFVCAGGRDEPPPAALAGRPERGSTSFRATCSLRGGHCSGAPANRGGGATQLLPRGQEDPRAPSRLIGWVDPAPSDGGVDQDSAAECGGEASAPRMAREAANTRVGLRRDHRSGAPSIRLVGWQASVATLRGGVTSPSRLADRRLGFRQAGTLAVAGARAPFAERRATPTMAALTAMIDSRPTHCSASPVPSPQYGLEGPTSTGMT